MGKRRLDAPPPPLPTCKTARAPCRLHPAFLFPTMLTPMLLNPELLYPMLPCGPATHGTLPGGGHSMILYMVHARPQHWLPVSKLRVAFRWDQEPSGQADATKDSPAPAWLLPMTLRHGSVVWCGGRSG